MNKTIYKETIVSTEETFSAAPSADMHLSNTLSPVDATEKLEEKWEKAGIGNAFIFGKVMSTNADLLLELLQLSLPEMEIEGISTANSEASIKTSIDAHGVRLDIIVRDYTGRSYNVEMQLRNERNIPKRMRYYGGSLDQTNLKPGEGYNKLKDTVILFITPFDPFDRRRYRYTFRNICLEEKKRLELGDGTTKVILNAAGETGDISPALKDFLNLVMGIYLPGGSSYADRVQKQVQIAKRNSTWRREYMNWEMTLAVERDKGMDIGEIRHLIRQIMSKSSLGQSEKQISEDLLEDYSHVHEICSIIASFGNTSPKPEDVLVKYLKEQSEKSK